jgi:hypothetical protein
METVYIFSPVVLKPDRSLEVQDGSGITVRVTRGNVWITQRGDPRDVVLGAGQSFKLDRNGLALVAALGGTATVLLIPADQRGRQAPSGDIPVAA